MKESRKSRSGPKRNEVNGESRDMAFSYFYAIKGEKRVFECHAWDIMADFESFGHLINLC